MTDLDIKNVSKTYPTYLLKNVILVWTLSQYV